MNNFLEQPIYLFGAGGAASWILNGFKRENIKVNGFLDDMAYKIKNVCGIPVYNPKDLKFSKEDKEKSIVVFCIMTPKVNIKNIIKKLNDGGWKNVYTFSFFGKELYNQTKKVRCSMVDPVDIENNIEKINQVRQILTDDKSKKILDGYLNFVLSLDDSYFPPIDNHPYFPSDIPRLNNPIRFIDCGGFNGDTIEDAIANGYELEKAISFEPDPLNFKLLAKNIKKYKDIIAVPCGVYSETKILKFKNQNDMGSFIDDTGNMMIQCVSLDDMIPCFSPTFIKMDIEGSEKDALIGCETLLKTNKPNLAISVYHVSTHIYDIPLYLFQIYGTEYNYYLRRHSRTIADIVFYVKKK